VTTNPFAFPPKEAKPLDVVTWGETMLRLSPAEGVALEAAGSLEISAGGTESNMAIGLARLGRRVGWSSRLPDNPLGRRIARDIAAQGVDVSRVLWARGDQGERAGLLFIEPGAAPRPNRVLYDRAGSAIARLNPAELDYAYLASGRVLFLTGITPALSASCREAWLRSAQEARRAGCAVVVDVNFRSKLWSPQAARETLEAVFPHVEAVFCGLADLQLLFGMPQEPALAAESFARAYRIPLVVLTLGAQGALAWREGKVLTHPVFPTQVVDRIGSGDAFAAGFLHGWLEGTLERALALGNAMAALKQTYRGDATWATRAEVEELLTQGGGDSRSVSR